MYEQDWLDYEFDNLYYLQESATAAREWFVETVAPTCNTTPLVTIAVVCHFPHAYYH